MGVTIIGVWAVGAQSFPEPYSKIIAVLSPGVGYIVGHAFDGFIRWSSNMFNQRAQQNNLKAMDVAIMRLNKEKGDAVSNGADASVIELIDKTLVEAIKKRVTIVATPVTVNIR